MKTLLSIAMITILATSCTKEPVFSKPGKVQSTVQFTINATAGTPHKFTITGTGSISGNMDFGNSSSVNFSGTNSVDITFSYLTPGVYIATLTISCPIGNITGLQANIAEISAINNLGNLAELKTINFHHNQLTSIDLSQNKKLFEISLYDNQLASLDLSGNPVLQNLIVFNNQLSSLNISTNPALFLLSVPGNNLTSIDISGNPALLQVSVEKNKLSSLAVTGLLDQLNAFGLTSGQFASFYQTPLAPPSAVSKQNLINKNWVVTTD